MLLFAYFPEALQKLRQDQNFGIPMEKEKDLST